MDILHRPRAVARAVSALRGAGTLGRREIEAVDRIIAYTAENLTDLAELQQHERWAYRSATMELLRRAPSMDQDLRMWIQQTAGILSELVGRFSDDPVHKAGHVLRSSKKQEGHVTRDVIRARAHGLRAQTVHDIKGESRGAVLVVIDPKKPRGRPAQSALWSQHLRGETVAEEHAEELRIAFVALTRARRYCAVALPDGSAADVLDAFTSVGFVLA